MPINFFRSLFEENTQNKGLEETIRGILDNPIKSAGRLAAWPARSSYNSEGADILRTILQHKVMPAARRVTGTENLSKDRVQGYQRTPTKQLSRLAKSQPGFEDFSIPDPFKPPMFDPEQKAREIADEYVQAQLNAIDKARGAARENTEFSSSQVGNTYKSLAGQIGEDASGIKDTYQQAIEQTDDAYSQANAGNQQQLKETTGNVGEVLKRLGLQQGAGDILGQLAAATQESSSFNEGTSADTQSMYSGLQANALTANTANQQAAVAAGNEKQALLQQQLLQILGELDMSAAEAQGRGTEMYGNLFSQFDESMYNRQKQYDDSLYQRQLDEYGINADMLDRQMQLQELQGGAAQEVPSYESTYQHAMNLIGDPQATAQLMTAMNNVAATVNAKQGVTGYGNNAAEFAANVKRMYPQIRQAYGDAVIDSIASYMYAAQNPNQIPFAEQQIRRQ